MYKPIYPGTYYFNNFTFTSMGNSGHRGPTSDQTYADAPWPSSSYFSIKNGQQNWTVPANGTYQITAAGAYGATPGRVVTGQVTLREGQVLTMLIGQQPTPLTANVADNVTVGGGGGTFVVTNGIPLIVASGGDGSGPSSRSGSFLPSGNGSGGSGAGYYGNGTQTNPYFQFLVPNSYINGGYGNRYEYGQPTLLEDGGFGGGQSPINLVTNIDKITASGGVATCYTHVPHGYPYNYVVNISGTTYYDGAQQIQVQASNAFTFSTSNTQTVTSGTVSGISSGSSGGGGYTGSPGDGTSGATCYADPSVQNFTDLGATSDASGYVTISLVNPVPITQTPTWNQTWTYQPSAFPYPTTWSACAYGNGTYVAVSNNGTYPVTYSPDGLNWYTQTYGSSVQPWVSVTFGNGLFVAVASNGHSMVSPDGINWTEAVGNGTAWTSVAGGNGIFTATAPDIGAAYSPDGLNWTTSSVVQPDTWTAVTYGQGTFNITNAPFISNGQNVGDELGYAIALSADGSILAVGAPYGNNYNGNVYVYTNGQLSYTLQGQYEGFGYSVALSADGSILAVNEQYYTNPRVYVYTNGVLTYTVPGMSSYQLAQNIALSADGSILAVGKPDQYPQSVYVYTNGQLSYTAQGQNAYDAFGFSVALSADGSILAVGGSNYNTVYVYTNGVLTYTVSETVSATFGWRVALSADGSVLAVSAFALFGGVGAVYVYKNGTPLVFSPLQTQTSDDHFGQGLAMNADGSVLAVGAPIANYITGAVYLYINGVLSETVYSIDPLDPDTYFGQSVALYADGSYLAVGAPGANYNTGYVALYRPPSNYTSLFVAVANNGTTANVMYSSDGNVWSNVTAGAYLNEAWSAVTYGNGTFVASANDGPNYTHFIYSINGQYWFTYGIAEVPFSSNCITYGNGYFAIPSSNTAVPQVAFAPSLTVPWQYSTVPSASYTGITYGPRGFVGVSPTQFTLGFSPQFWINPAQVSTSNKLNSSYWNGLAYGNGTFVAVGNGLIQGTRNQGNTWNSYVSSNVACITYSQNLGTFVAVSNTFVYGTYTSHDGLNWTQNTNLPSAVPSATTAITYGNGLFVSVLNGDSNVLTSRDGVYWNLEQGAIAVARWTSIAYGSGVFVAVGSSIIARSIDGNSWGTLIPLNSYSFQIQTPGIFLPYPISVSNDGNTVLISSLDYSPNVYTNGVLTSSFSAPRQNEGFGWASAMNSNGQIIAIGAPNANSNVGNVYVYSNGTLSYTLKGANANVFFGSSLALSASGSVLAVGAPGTGYVNVYTNGTLTRTFVGETVGDGFGWATAISADGTVFAVSALNIGFGISGAQKVYYTKGATTYALAGDLYSDGFGWAIALSGDGTVLAVSAYFAGYVNVYHNGVFAYKIQGLSVNQFGWALSMNYHGSVLAVCAPTVSNVYVYNGSGTLINTYNGAGWQVAVNYDGEYIVSSSQYGTTVNVFLSLDTWQTVTYGNGLFVAIGFSNTPEPQAVVIASPDGNVWTRGTIPNGNWSSVTYGNGFFMAVSNNGTYPVAYSQDGINWSTQTTGFQTTNWSSIAFGQNTFMAVNAQGATTMITQLGETF